MLGQGPAGLRAGVPGAGRLGKLGEHAQCGNIRPRATGRRGASRRGRGAGEDTSATTTAGLQQGSEKRRPSRSRAPPPPRTRGAPQLAPFPFGPEVGGGLPEGPPLRPARPGARTPGVPCAAQHSPARTPPRAHPARRDAGRTQPARPLPAAAQAPESVARRRVPLAPRGPRRGAPCPPALASDPGSGHRRGRARALGVLGEGGQRPAGPEGRAGQSWAGTSVLRAHSRPPHGPRLQGCAPRAPRASPVRSVRPASRAGIVLVPV